MQIRLPDDMNGCTDKTFYYLLKSSENKVLN